MAKKTAASTHIAKPTHLEKPAESGVPEYCPMCKTMSVFYIDYDRGGWLACGNCGCI